MKLRAILFDLDGTLLPMDQDVFTKAYFKELCKVLVPRGYEPQSLIAGIWSGVRDIVANGSPETTGEERFWKCFAKELGEHVLSDKPRINRFYDREFNNAVSSTQPTPLAKQAVELAGRKAELVILATNPIFPRNGVLSRMNWAGISADSFAQITSYEYCHYSKPDPRYYQEILSRFDLKPDECLMIGNDVGEDMLPAQKLGMHTFLLKDCMIGDASAVETDGGSFDELIRFLNDLPDTD